MVLINMQLYSRFPVSPETVQHLPEYIGLLYKVILLSYTEGIPPWPIKVSCLGL